MRLQVRKVHLDSLPLIARFQERLCLHFAASDVAGILIDVAHDPALRCVGAANRASKRFASASRQALLIVSILSARRPAWTWAHPHQVDHQPVCVSAVWAAGVYRAALLGLPFCYRNSVHCAAFISS
jgi:hypothetical protein